MRSHMKVVALIMALITVFTVSASAFSLPEDFKYSESKPKGDVEAVILTETANFYSTEGKLTTLNRGDKVTVMGMKDETYAKVKAAGVKGYVKAECLMSTVGVSAYVAKDCWAYQVGGEKKARAVWGTKVYMVGRMTDKDGEAWILCVNKKGTGLAAIKKSNLYR